MCSHLTFGTKIVFTWKRKISIKFDPIFGAIKTWWSSGQNWKTATHILDIWCLHRYNLYRFQIQHHILGLGKLFHSWDFLQLYIQLKLFEINYKSTPPPNTKYDSSNFSLPTGKRGRVNTFRHDQSLVFAPWQISRHDVWNNQCKMNGMDRCNSMLMTHTVPFL